MTKFKRKNRYDSARASEGIWVDAGDNGEFGSFLVRFVDPSLTSVDLELKRIRASRAASLKMKNLTDVLALRALVVDYALLDWKCIEDEDGKEVPFSTEAAWEFFGEESENWILQQIASEAVTVENFKGVDPVKNS